MWAARVVQSGMPSAKVTLVCAGFASVVAVTAHAQSAPRPNGPTYKLPEGAIDVSCPVTTTLEAVVHKGTRLTLKASLVNRSASPEIVTVRNRCPQGPVRITGLPPGTDATQSCNKGPCVVPETMKEITVPAKRSVVLAELTLDANGDTCNRAFPVGRLALTAEVDSPRAWQVCPGWGVTLVRSAARGPLRVASPDELQPSAPTPKIEKAAKPAPKKPAKPAPVVKKVRKRPCPACGIGCIDGIPLQGTGPDGCPLCGCERLGATIGR